MNRHTISIIRYVCLALFIIGAIMRLMHWPFHALVRYTGLVGWIVCLVLLRFVKQEGPTNDDLDDKTLDSFGKN